MKRIENESESAQNEYQQQHKSLYSRLAANAYKYQYLHKLDDRTLLNYKETLRKQLQKLERFREAAFGPHSVAKHQPNPQTSWFFRRRTSKSAPRQRAGKSMSPPRQRLPPTVLSPQSQPSARAAQSKPKKPAGRKLPPIEKSKSAKKAKTIAASSSQSRSSAGVQQKLPPTAVIRPSKKAEEKDTKEMTQRSSSGASGEKLPALGVAAAVGVAAAAGAAGLGLSVSDPEPHPEISDTDYSSRPETEASGGLPTSDADLTDATSPQPHSDVEPEQAAGDHEEEGVEGQTPPLDQGENTPQEGTPHEPEPPIESPVRVHQQKAEVPEHLEEHHDEEEIHVRHARAIHSEPPASEDFELQRQEGETLSSDVEMASPITELPPPTHQEEEVEQARADHYDEIEEHREPSDSEDARSNATHEAEPEHHSMDDFNALDSHRSATAKEAEHHEQSGDVPPSDHETHETPEPVAPNQRHDDYAPTDEHRGASAMSKDSIEALAHTQAHEPQHEETALNPEHFEPLHAESGHEEYGYAEQNDDDSSAHPLPDHTEEVTYENYEHDQQMVDVADHQYEADGHNGHQDNEEDHEQQAESPTEMKAPDSPVQQDLPVHHDEAPMSPPESPIERREYSQQQAEPPTEHQQDEHEEHSVETPRSEQQTDDGHNVMNQSVYEHHDMYEEMAQEAQGHVPPEHKEEMNYEDYEHDPQMIEIADRYVESEAAQHSPQEHPEHNDEHYKEDHKDGHEEQQDEGEVRNTPMSQSMYHEPEGGAQTVDDHEEVQSMKRYDQHRDSFAESESEPNLHYQTESLQQPPTAGTNYANVGTFHELPDEDESMPIMEGESLRDTDEDDSLGQSMNTQQSEAAPPAQDGDSMTAVDSLRMDSVPQDRTVEETFDSMAVQHDDQRDPSDLNTDRPEVFEQAQYVPDHQRYGHEEHEYDEHRFHEEEADNGHKGQHDQVEVTSEAKQEAEERSEPPTTRSSTHQSLLVPQPSIEITPASDYGGSSDRLDQVDVQGTPQSTLSNENDDSGHPTAVDSAESEYTEDRSRPSTQRDDGSANPDASEDHQPEDTEEIIPPPVHHSSLAAEDHEEASMEKEAAYHLPESPNPDAHSTLIPEQHDEEGEALTVPEEDQVEPRDSIPDEYVIDELGLTDGGHETKEHQDEHTTGEEQESTYVASNYDDDGHSEQPPSTGRTADSADQHDHDRQQLSSGYGGEEQTSDVDAYIRAHEHEIHGGNPHDIYTHHHHDPEAEDLMNSNIHAADPMHEAVDAHESHDANENGVHHHKPTGEDVSMEMHTNGINGNDHHDSNGFHSEENEHSTTSGDHQNGAPDTARTAQTDESHPEPQPVRKSVDFGNEGANEGSEQEEGSDTGSVVIHEEAERHPPAHAPTTTATIDAATGAEQLTSHGLPG